MLQNLKTLLAKPEDECEYALLENQEEELGRLGVLVDRIESFTDSDRIIKALREGKVTFAKLGKFKDTNLDELRRTLGKIKAVCKAMDGEIVSVSNNEWIIVSPPSCRIVR
jgi:SepF-like predicted cell division protein (DUF552 family)